MKTYRYNKNQSTNKRVSIERLDKKSNMLTSNDTFLKYFECKIKVELGGKEITSKGIIVHEHYLMYYNYGINNAECNCSCFESLLIIYSNHFVKKISCILT